MPWLILAAGLLAAILATVVAEILGRRREYAMRLVDVRTEDLRRSLDELASVHEQLVRQERLAAIGQLASSIGHELRNPLGVINNAMYLLRRDFGPEPSDAAQRHLTTAEREISAATVIVSDLLEFARQRQPVIDDLDVTALLDEVLSVLPPPTGIRVVRDFPADPVTVPADRDMLRQVMLNLVGNGYQAMADGGELTMGLTVHDGAVEVVVTDTGVGMDDEVRERLFEPFFTTKARGIGLGLAVCKRIVDAHSGALTVESAPQAGSTFHLVLPAIASPRRSEESSPPVEVTG
jgi:signal transduction histidine kinase